MFQKIIKFLIFYLTFPFLWLISILPDRLFYFISDIVNLFIFKILGYRKKIIRNNLQIAFPDKSLDEIKIIENKFHQHFCDIFMEMIKTITISKELISKKMTFTNLEVLQPSINSNRSFIIMCGHYNSYEWLLTLAQYIHCPSYAIYTPITNKYFDNLIKKSRSRFNAFLISRYEIHSIIYQNKNKMGAYGFASDQSPSNSHKQYRRNFLGVKVPVFTGAERIAKQFDMPVFFCNIEKVKRGYYQATFELISNQPKMIENYAITDKFTELLEAQIRKAPEYYLWTHNRFKYKSID